MRRRVFATLVCSLLLLAGGTAARTWEVFPDGTGDAPTIAAAMDSVASAGDTVLVMCGLYHEHDIPLSQGVVLRSESGEPACVRIDAEGLGRVLLLQSVHVAARIEGLTLQGGVASGSGTAGRGGGILADESAAYMRDCRLEGNRAQGGGGGIWFLRSAAEVSGCEFLSNESPSGGGAGCSETDLTLSDCEFRGNSGAAGDGGGFWAGASGVGLTECRFLDNSAGSGGGLMCHNHSALALVDCEFTGNAATGAGGCGGGLYGSICQIELERCRFVENSGWNGGGASFAGYWAGSTRDLVECTFLRNHAYRGGGISTESYTTIEGSVLAENTADLGGGAILFGTLVMERSTLYGNGANYGSALYSPGGGGATLSNCVLASGTGGSAVWGWGGAQAALHCCDVFGNEGGDFVGILVGQDEVEWNFSADPLFCDAAAGDFTVDVSSPCLHAIHCEPVGAFGTGCDMATAVASADPTAPRVPFLAGNSPNPFNPTTVVRYGLPDAADLTLAVHDLAGRRVTLLAAGRQEAGEHQRTWDGTDAEGRPLPSGVYFLRFTCGEHVAVRKAMLLR